MAVTMTLQTQDHFVSSVRSEASLPANPETSSNAPDNTHEPIVSASVRPVPHTYMAPDGKDNSSTITNTMADTGTNTDIDTGLGMGISTGTGISIDAGTSTGTGISSDTGTSTGTGTDKSSETNTDTDTGTNTDTLVDSESEEEHDTSDVFFRMRNINKVYHMGEEDMHVLKDICLDINRGEYLSILGPSGSGKSTLMNIIGCLDVPTSGKYTLNGSIIDDLTEAELAHIRSSQIGFIFQNHQLLPRLTALKNVELPLIYAGVPPKERKKRALHMLDRVGLGDRVDHYPNQLSGGQNQRVAIARAMIGNPSILLADEPTGALDQKTGRQVMQLFQELNKEGRTIIMITHDMHIAEYAHRVVHIIDGILTEGGSREDA